MRRTSLAAVLFVLTCAPIVHAAGTPSPNDYLGLELAPGWLNVVPSAPVEPDPSASYDHARTRSFAHYSWGFAATLRLSRVGGDNWYWTPLQFGLGVGSEADGGSPTAGAGMIHISSEAGLRQSLRAGLFVEVGGAFGVGLFSVSFGKWCEGSCSAGGGPVIASPVVRVGVAKWGTALVARAFFSPAVATFRITEADGAAFLFGIDVLLR